MIIKFEFIFYFLLIIAIILVAIVYIMQKHNKSGGVENPVSDTIELSREYNNWQKNNKILSKLTAGKTKRERYEISNMLEWILLEKFNGRTDVKKITEELSERFEKKKIIPNVPIKTIIEQIFNNSKQTKPVTKILWKINNNGTIIINSYFAKYSPERIAILLKKASPYEIARMLMRYASMLIGGQQWNIPRAVYAFVHDEFGVDLEGFASPINSQLLAVCPDMCNFCSLFLDVDKPFGSLGSVFDISLLGRRCILNPPYVLTIMDKISKKMIKTIDEAEEKKIDTLIINTVVAWTDADYYIRLMNYKNAINFNLKAFEYSYENSNNLDKKILASFDSTIFVLAYPKPTISKYKSIKEKFLHIGKGL